jgi:hypothetical protein
LSRLVSFEFDAFSTANRKSTSPENALFRGSAIPRNEMSGTHACAHFGAMQQ